jgi:hypothetical protein
MFARLGEQTGTLPTMLQRTAQQLSADVERRALQLATISEPLLIVVMGVVVHADRAGGDASDHPTQPMGTINNMGVSLQGKLVVAISSRALFDFEEENRALEQNDDRAYMNLQLERLDAPAKPGVAFSLVKKLLAFNSPDAAARRSGHFVAQRPGEWHAGVSLSTALRLTD